MSRGCGDCDACRARERIRREIERGELARYIVSFSRREGFQGAVVVRAFGPLDAVDQTLKRGLAVRADETVIADLPPDVEVPDSSMNRLLSEIDCRMLGMVLVDFGKGEVDAGAAKA